MPKKLKTQVYLVELINRTDRADDEALKVRAISKSDARDVARGQFNAMRFSIGDVVLARGNITKKDKETAEHLRSICINSR